MQNWKKVFVLGAIGAGAALTISGRRPLGIALTVGGIALLASEYPEKFEGLLEDAPEYLNKGMEILATLRKLGGAFVEESERLSADALHDIHAQFTD